MAKGRTNQPLSLLVDQELYKTKEIQALIAQGHTVHPFADLVSLYHVILGRRCARMTPELIKYLPMALTGARAERYPRKLKKNKEAVA